MCVKRDPAGSARAKRNAGAAFNAAPALDKTPACRASPSRRLLDVLAHPGFDELDDDVAVFLQHHLVAVTFDTDVLEADELRVPACLVDPNCRDPDGPGPGST